MCGVLPQVKLPSYFACGKLALLGLVSDTPAPPPLVLFMQVKLISVVLQRMS
jgi:hypothetical protein